jgi:hypothetical protein
MTNSSSKCLFFKGENFLFIYLSIFLKALLLAYISFTGGFIVTFLNTLTMFIG